MKKIILIGGGEVGRGNSSYETKEIDEEIVKLTKTSNPTFLFIGLASSFSDSYYDTMKKIYKNLGCICTYLKKKNILNNPDIVKEKIQSADIIYICGGDTVKLINDIKEYQIDSLLKKAYEKGTILAGISAGAILLSKGGFSDALILRNESTKNTYLKGLDFVDINFCPHYDKSSKKAQELNDYLKTTTDKFYCLENCTALKIIDDEITIIKSNKNNKGFIISNINNQIHTQEINKILHLETH